MELIYLLIILIIIFFVVFYLNNHRENFLISHEKERNKQLFEFNLPYTIPQTVVGLNYNLKQYYIYNEYNNEKYYLTRLEIERENKIQEKHYVFIKPKSDRNQKFYCDIFNTYENITDAKKDLDIIPNLNILNTGKVKLSTDISVNKNTDFFFTDNNFRLRKHRQYIDKEEKNIYSDEFDFNIHKYPTNNNDNLYIIKYIDKTTNKRYYLKNLIEDCDNFEIDSGNPDQYECKDGNKIKKHLSIDSDINIYLTEQEEFDSDLHENKVELYLMEIKPFYKKTNDYEHIIFGNDDCN